MEIIKSSGNIDKKAMFNMTEGGSSNKVSAAIGEVIDLAGWVLYRTEDSKGNPVTALSLLQKNGLIYATISETFIKKFDKIVAFAEKELDGVFDIRVIGGTSKNGCQYVDCEIA